MAMARNTDLDWKHFGEHNPFYGVLSHPEFSNSNLTPASIEQFYDSGAEHVQAVLKRAEQLFGEQPRFRQIVDFGCGVGRLTLPFARYADEVIGIDVSEGMLAKARERCARTGVYNVRFLIGNDALSGLSIRPDLIHSFIVFQHIPVARGMSIIQSLLDHLAPGGTGALHITFGMVASRATEAEKVRRNRRKRLVKRILDHLPNFFMRPYMQMNDYRVDQILVKLHTAGATCVHIDLVEQVGHLGGFFYFRKETVLPAPPPQA
jgi:SAM-dependent methyltransferase